MQIHQKHIFLGFYCFFCYFWFFFQKHFKKEVKNWVTTDALSLQYLQSKNLFSAWHSKFVKTNKLLFQN
jgi:hypothetical protein